MRCGGCRSPGRFLALGVLIGGLACGEHGPAPASVSARPAPEIRLVERGGAIHGEARADPAVIRAWSAPALAAWSRRDEDAGWSITSPPLEHLRDVGAVTLELAPGGANRLVLRPTLHGDRGHMLQRARQLEVPLEPVAPGQIVTLRIELHETLAGNWMDTVREPELVRLELALRNADPAQARWVELRVLRHDAIATPFAARRAMAERSGRLHPSWWVRADAGVGLAIEVPARAPELRWHAGGLAAGARPRVAIRDEAGEHVLDEGDAGSSDPAAWQTRHASLARFAGRRVTLALSNGGSGVALFGDPRVVAAADTTRPPDVLVYLIDALRADHVGALGGEADLTPNLDRLIREGRGFPMALSHSPWTKPSVVTILTGLLPTTHRVGSRTLSDRLPDGVPTLAERFRAAGWRTGSFVANPLGSTLSGLERGFGTTLPPRAWHRRPALGRHPSGRQIRDAFLAWLDQEPDRPFFAYLHVMEVHPSGRRLLVEGSVDDAQAYRAGVRAADRDLGDVVEALVRRGRDVLVVALADHGDSLGDHGRAHYGHGTSLYQDQIHVPLVLSPRRLAPSLADEGPVGLVDVAPALLARFALPPLEGADGAADGSPPPVPSALLRFPHAPDAPTQHALVDAALRKVIRIGDAAPLYFDLKRDPGEKGAPTPDDVEALHRSLEERIAAYPEAAARFRTRHGSALPATVDASQLERLRALGYIE